MGVVSTDAAADKGQIIFLEGVPSSGKTTVARELRKRVLELRIIHGDSEIKRLARRRPRNPRQLFEALLELVDKASQKNDVVLDMTLPGTYVMNARQRLSDAFFVSLRVAEDEGLAREKLRRRQKPLVWNEEIAAQQGGEELFDLVIDTSARTPAECAEIILDQFEAEDNSDDS